jgi:hypothetical protein
MDNVQKTNNGIMKGYVKLTVLTGRALTLVVNAFTTLVFS